jgi:hypothetical protein
MAAWILIGLLAVLTLSGIFLEAWIHKTKHQAELDRRKHKFGTYHL